MAIDDIEGIRAGDSGVFGASLSLKFSDRVLYNGGEPAAEVGVNR